MLKFSQKISENWEEKIRKIKPSCDIFLNKEKRLFSLLDFAVERENMFTVACGAMKYISNFDMKSEGIHIVLRSLLSFHNRECTKSELELMSANQRNKFIREHKLIGVTLCQENKLLINPMHREKGGHIGKPGEEIIINLPCNNEEFYQKLMEAFSRC